jgi:hypothetical protein
MYVLVAHATLMCCATEPQTTDCRMLLCTPVLLTCEHSWTHAWYACPASVLQVQREYLDTQIRGLSNSHVVQPGIKREMVPLVPAHGRIKEIALPVQVCCHLCCANSANY